MISTTQSEALAVLTELCALSPDVRLGQLMAHLGLLGQDRTGRTLWDIDDEELLAVLYHHRSELTGRTPDPSSRPLQGAIAPSLSGASDSPHSTAR